MLRVIIIEDEAPTARNLAHLLQIIDSSITVICTLGSVKDTVAWFSQHPNDYDLVFMDIRLADGLSFEIFKKASVTRPVIFVTAYHDHAIQAFKNNGIDYILKPFDEQELKQALNKYNTWYRDTGNEHEKSITQLIAQLGSITKSYKKSFLVHFRDKLIPVETVKMAWFYTANDMVYAQTFDNRQYIMEFTLEQLEQQLDPVLFFRANRQFIINRDMVTDAGFYFNGRLLVNVKPLPPERILVSKARVPAFKSWMNS